MTVDFSFPREERAVLLDGYNVPLLEGREAKDGASASFVFDGRYAYDVPIEQAETFVWFMAQAVATCWGYLCHPGPTTWEPVDGRDPRYARVPHPSLQPRLQMCIGEIETSAPA